MIRFAILIPFLATPIAFAAQPTTDPLKQQLDDHKAHEHSDYLKELHDAQELKLAHSAITDIFDLSIDDAGMLLVHPKIHATDGIARCTITGLAGPCTVMSFADKADHSGQLVALQFTHRDFSRDDEIFRNTMMFAHQGSVQISMDVDGLIQSRDVSLVQNLSSDDPEMAVELYAQLIDPVTDATIGQSKITAASFRELREKHPRETQQFVVPILRDLQCESILAPDPRVAYQVFQTQFKPDAELSKKIDAALKKFDADDFQVREAASRDLSALGQSAALALTHADRKGWSIDRRNGVDNFLSQYKALPLDQVDAMKNKPVFLLDCLYSDDVQIRAAAATALEPLIKQKIDPTAVGVAKTQAIDRVAGVLFPPITTMPATQP